VTAGLRLGAAVNFCQHTKHGVNTQQSRSIFAANSSRYGVSCEARVLITQQRGSMAVACSDAAAAAAAAAACISRSEGV
jgi:hypothetical protein